MKKSEYESEIKSLNFIILAQRDRINLLEAERDKYLSICNLIMKLGYPIPIIVNEIAKDRIKLSEIKI